MSDHFEHNPDDHEDPLPGPTWLIGFVMTALLAVIVLGLVGVYYGARQNEDERKVLNSNPLAELETIRRVQEDRLNAQPHWEITKDDDRIVDRRLVVPIETAMKQFVAEQSRR